MSLPIPSGDARRYRDVRGPDDRSLGSLLARLGRPRTLVRGHCHLDPDLDGEAVARRPGWRPTFGSVGAAGTHLANERVGPGDLFLFFGWFRHTEARGARLRYRPGTDMHLLFGYLQVEAVLRPARRRDLPAWLHDHPHADAARIGRVGNVLFVARERLALPGCAESLPGAGMLPFAEHRVLTAPGHPRSRWRLPPGLFGSVPISYHRPSAWREGYFQSAARGQDFVLRTTAPIRRWIGDRLAPATT